MAYQHTQSQNSLNFDWTPLVFVKSVLSGIGAFLVAIPEANQRMQELERLQAKSDEQLAQLGLRREDIARHVFRDMLHI